MREQEAALPVGDKDFKAVMAGLHSMKAIKDGNADPASFNVHVPTKVNVRAIRQRLKLTQTAFASRFGFSPGAVRD